MTGSPAVSFVAPAAYPLGGVATWLDRIVPDLRDQGVDAQVILACGRQHDGDAYLRAHPAIAPALQVRPATATRESRIQALANLLSPMLTTHPRHTLVSVNIPDLVLAVARVRERDGATGLRAVMSIHGLEPDLFADLANLAPLLDGVICTNRLAQARARQIAGLDPDRVHYAPYGTPLPSSTHAVPRAGPPDAPFTIGFAGRFEQFQKRIQDLDPIATALARRGVEAHWLLAGDGPDGERIDAMARNHPRRVERLGSVAPQRMQQDFHARCHVLLNPGEWETGPIIVWEAMANRVAVVSSRYTGSGREAALVDGDNCLLFDTGDIESAAGCLQRLCDPGLRARLCDAAANLVRERYSPRASCMAWSAALAAIARASPRTAAEPAMPSAGRLDRWFGARTAERLRRCMPGRYAADAPGDEWPHTHVGGRREDAGHWRALRALDAPAPQQRTSAGTGGHHE